MGTPVLKVVQGPRRPRRLCLVRVQPSPSDDLAKPTVLPVRLAINSWFTSFASISGMLHSRRKSTGTFCCTGYRRRRSRHVAFLAKKYRHILLYRVPPKAVPACCVPGENVPAYLDCPGYREGGTGKKLSPGNPAKVSRHIAFPSRCDPTIKPVPT